MRQLLIYVKPYVAKALLISSGVFIGINNYDEIISFKDSLLQKTLSNTNNSSVSYLEELVRLKDE